MKRIIVLITGLALFNIPLSAQTEKGSLILGGSGSLGITSSDNESAFNFFIGPDAGVFVQDNLAIGGILNFGISSSNDQTFISYGFSPFLRYYFDLLSENSKIFLLGSIGPQGRSTEFNNITNSETGFTAQVGAGIDFFLNESVALEGLLVYNYNKFSESFSFSSFGIWFGFQIFLPSEPQ